MADREGFEPSFALTKHTFQACALDHSATCPQESYGAPCASTRPA